MSDLWRMFHLRRWMFAGIVCVLTALFAVGAYLIPNTFEASATILLEQKPIAETGVGTVRLIPDLEQRLRIFNTLVMSEYLLKKVITRLKLVPNSHDPVQVAEKIEELREGISVKIQETDSLQIFYQGKNPRLVMQVTNELANFFLEDTLRFMEKSLGGTMRFLEEQLAATEQQLEAQEAKIMAFKDEHYEELPQHITGHQTAVSRLVLQKDTLAREVRDLQRQKKRAQLQLVELETSFGLEDDGEEDREGAKAKALLEDKILALEAAKAENTPQHPDVIALEEEVRVLEASIQQVARDFEKKKEKEKKGEGVHPALAQSLEYKALKEQVQDSSEEISNVRRKIAELEKAIQEHEVSLEATYESEQDYVKLTRGYEVLKERYQTLYNKKLDAQLSTRLEQVQQEEKFQILDAATLPFEPIWPNRPLLAGIGGVVSLAIGLGIVFLLGLLDQRVYTPQQLIQMNSLPMLGAIPHFSIENPARRFWSARKALPAPQPAVEQGRNGANGNGGSRVLPNEPMVPMPQTDVSPFLIMVKGNDWFAREQYRQFRSSLKFSARQDRTQLFMVTSSFPGEGKTVTASNLAVALGLEDYQDVLLIDGELRKSQVHDLFGLPLSPGLAELLQGEASIDEVLHPGPVETLSVMTAGRFEGNPADLFEKPSFSQLLQVLKERFHYIVIDSPPDPSRGRWPDPQPFDRWGHFGSASGDHDGKRLAGHTPAIKAYPCGGNGVE